MGVVLFGVRWFFELTLLVVHFVQVVHFVPMLLLFPGGVGGGVSVGDGSSPIV